MILKSIVRRPLLFSRISRNAAIDYTFVGDKRTSLEDYVMNLNYQPLYEDIFSKYTFDQYHENLENMISQGFTRYNFRKVYKLRPETLLGELYPRSKNTLNGLSAYLKETFGVSNSNFVDIITEYPWILDFSNSEIKEKIERFRKEFNIPQVFLDVEIGYNKKGSSASNLDIFKG